MSGNFTESVVEDAALAWLEAIGWHVAHGPDIAPDMPAPERADRGEGVPAPRLRSVLESVSIRPTRRPAFNRTSNLRSAEP